MNENKVPQDIIDAAIQSQQSLPINGWDTPSAPIAVRFAGYLQQHYEFCETGGMVQLKGGVQTDIATIYKLWCERKGITEQSQSVQPKEDVTEYYVSDRIELLAGKWRIESGIADKYAFNTQLNSVNTEIRDAYIAGAARNLSVGNGWADSAIIDTFQAAREFNSQDGVVDIDVVISFTGADNSDLSPVYANAEEFLQQYKLTHYPVVDSRIQEMRQWLQTRVSADTTRDYVLSKFTELFPTDNTKENQ